MISKSGGNAVQRLRRLDATSRFSGTATTPAAPARRRRGQVNQADFSFGGPIRRDKVWFFGAVSLQNNESDTEPHPGRGVAALQALLPDDTRSRTTSLKSHQPCAKVTAQARRATTTLSGVYQGDRLHCSRSVRANDYIRSRCCRPAAAMYGAQAHVGLGQQRHHHASRPATTTRAATGSTATTGGSSRPEHRRPSRGVHRRAGAGHRDRPAGRDGGNCSVGCLGCMLDLDTSSVTMLRGDLTWFKDGLGRLARVPGRLPGPAGEQLRSGDVVYLNDGFIFEEQRLRSIRTTRRPARVPFHRQYVIGDLEPAHGVGARQATSASTCRTRGRRTTRLTATMGVRVDFVRRYDALRDFSRQKSTGDRAAPGLLVPVDQGRQERAARHLRARARAAAGRASRCVVVRRRRRGGAARHLRRSTATALRDGVRSRRRGRPRCPACSSIPDMSQPIIDEFIARLPAAVPRAGERGRRGHQRKIHNMFAQTDINGIYPSGPNQPFGGFGLVDPEPGHRLPADQQRLEPDALPGAPDHAWPRTCRTTSSALAAIHRQWQH